jgi:putative transposase
MPSYAHLSGNGTAFAYDGQTNIQCMYGEKDYRGMETCYFITFQTVDWVDVFIRPVYKQVIVHTLNHFIESRGLQVYAWCLMSNHLHLLAQASNGAVIAELEKEYINFTTTKILEAIETEPEARRKWMLQQFENSIGKPDIQQFQVWQNCNHPVLIDCRKRNLLLEHFEYIHQTPVRDKIVDIPGEYKYSSARDYSGINGLVNIVKLPAIEQQLAASETMNGNFFVKYIRN